MDDELRYIIIVFVDRQPAIWYLQFTVFIERVYDTKIFLLNFRILHYLDMMLAQFLRQFLFRSVFDLCGNSNSNNCKDSRIIL